MRRTDPAGIAPVQDDPVRIDASSIDPAQLNVHELAVAGIDVSGTDGTRLFAYGSLQFADVLRALLGRIPELRPARAPGWRAAALRGRVYPGLVPAAAPAAAVGHVVLGLGTTEWRILHAFEGDAYEPRAVTLDDRTTATTYVWRDRSAVLAHDWDGAGFVAQHLHTFSARAAAWRAGRERPAGNWTG